MTPRYHNLLELRLFFALAVLLSHSLQLAGLGSAPWVRVIFSSERAVQAFFILSGFLVLGSFARAGGIRNFYLRRVFRIYPAYAFAVVFLLALVLAQAVILGAQPAWWEIPRYLAANLALLNFLHDTIGGVFAGNPYPHLNGALWTIKIEVAFYLILPAVYWIGRRRGFLFAGALLVILGLAWRPFLDFVALARSAPLHPSLSHQLPGQLHFFGLGALLYHMSRPGAGRAGAALVLAGAAGVALMTGQAGTALNMLALSALVLLVIHLPQARSPLHDRDLSYGVYLCHFPLIQMLVAARDWTGLEAVLVPLVLLLSLTYAWLSWQLIESPLLRWARRHETRD